MDLQTVNPEDVILYAAWGCPFSHRPLAALHLLGLEAHVPVLFVEDIKREEGWRFATPDLVFGARNLPELYQIAAPGGDHRPSVPILINRAARLILSTESLDILRWIATGFAGAVPVPLDLCPEPQRDEIAALVSFIHDRITRAVYRVGLTRDQQVYETECRALFDALDDIEQRLRGNDYLLGATPSEADLVLFPTLVRFDAIYGPLFRCSLARVTDYPGLSAYLRRCLAIPGLAASFDLGRAKTNYFRSIIHRPDGAFEINPSGIVPL
ncbi:glutathione S-transferase C-terminal domain-containing protein [Leisingera sp. JC1]|uniref:glutathione S-transferase C-terminal domain-containing protein n=1 Tax=Leisingera sp. JC1 TaxID=1855282 RepID=UPI000802ACAF|nr:glutathione S-transferase C-terminal domain-containing protein [Leisingera sp. JC1]OBY26563.1 hypothetical protein A9D60_18575 [Leisingera sp. JC1]